MLRLTLALLAAGLVGCASVSTIPLSQNSFQLTTKATPECSADQTQKVAFKRAAAETIKRGYDPFVVNGTEFRPETYGGGYYGVNTISNQALTVTMYRTGDPAGANGLVARDVLGPKWQEALAEQTFSCYGA